MDVLGMLWWIVRTILGLVWFLIGGWVATLVQILVLVLAVFVFKHGWRRGPLEMWQAGAGFRRLLVGWLGVARWRGGAAVSSAAPARGRVEVRTVRVKEWGDVNLSTLMTLAMIGGLAALASLR